MTPAIPVRPCDARILVAITVHFNVTRLEYLAEVMRSLNEFAVAAMHVVLVTNTVQDDELGLLRRLCGETLSGKTASIRCFEYLGHPHYLTWRHRDVIVSEFANGNDSGYTHFMYMEDDIRVSFANFSYFVEYREVLRHAGLLPSFLRVEYNRTLNGFVNSDNKAPVDLSRQPQIDHGDVILANIPFPYIACYILDTALVAEFLRTRSFKRESSRAVTEWEVRERAAMGLCHENVPEPFQCRYVVPVSRKTGMALGCAWISHLPNNYANDPASGFGKMRMDTLFENVGTPALQGGNLPAPSAVGTQIPAVMETVRPNRWKNIDLYMVLPNKIIEGLRWRLGFKR